MKVKLQHLISCITVLSLLVIFGQVAASPVFSEPNGTFSLEEIDPALSLSEALQKYPELYDIFYIKNVSREDAETLIRNGMRVLDCDGISAKVFFSLLNARKSNAYYNSIDSERYQYDNISRGPYGAAWPYVSKTGNSPNCYGYALGINTTLDPGQYSDSGAINYYASLSTISQKVSADLAQSWDGGGRVIDSNTSSIASYEWRIAFRTGAGLIPVDDILIFVWDYHFWLQTSTGTWCHKPGTTPSVHLGNVVPHTENWNMGSVVNFYNSNTVYMALTMNVIE